VTKIKPNYTTVILVLLGISLISYDNVKNHGTINEIIVNSFVDRNNGAPATFRKFKNYVFKFDDVELKGDFISEAGLFHPSEVPTLGARGIAGHNTTYTETQKTITPFEWISHGGFSADEPEVPAGLRHFYDPTKSEGKRHLNDTASSVISGWGQSWFPNPKIDGVSWALGGNTSSGTEEHNYTWERGKKYIKGALEETNPDKRNQFMARAWRSLGETLHMIADNGCPPHVRNDSHPPGNVAPYENILASVDLTQFQKGAVDQNLMKDFRKEKITVFDIAHKLAVYTNENFFSSETIAGTNQKGKRIKHITHPHDEYKLPKISPQDYENGYYIKKIAGQDVKVCTDKWFFSKFNIPKDQPFIDKNCAESIAKVLIPTIKEAGVNVMRLYIPALKITITSFGDNGTISGTIKHTTDSEYKTEIKYNGPVIIRNSGTKKLGTLTAKNGKFTGKINSVDSKVFAEIECGGIFIRSENKTRKVKQAAPQPEPEPENVMYINVRIFVYSTYDRGFKDEVQTFRQEGYHNYETSIEFKLPKSKKFKESNKYGTIEGELNGKEVVWLKVNYKEEWKNSKGKTREDKWIAELKKIPLDFIDATDSDREPDEIFGRYLLEGWEEGKQNPQFRKSLVKLERELVFYPSGEKATLVDIDYYETTVREYEAGRFFAPRPVIEVQVSSIQNY